MAGLALVMMEALADFGTVKHFEVDTFTTGIYLSWFGMGSPVGAAKLAAGLLLFVVLVIGLERISRGRRRYHQTEWAASDARAVPAAAAGRQAQPSLPAPCPSRSGSCCRLAGCSGSRCCTAISGSGRPSSRWQRTACCWHRAPACIAVLLAVVVAYGLRLAPSPLMKADRLDLDTRVHGARLGDRGRRAAAVWSVRQRRRRLDARDVRDLDGTVAERNGVRAAVRLRGPVPGAGLQQRRGRAWGGSRPAWTMRPGRSGSGPLGVLRRVHLPLLRGSLLTGALLVFVDTLKELPATLIIRPFNFDTLAIRVYLLASDERLSEAATAALTIVAVGIIPVILLSVAIGRARPTHAN